MADEVLYSSTEVDVLWADSDKPSPESLSRFQSRGRDLGNFYRGVVLKRIPGRLWKSGTPPPLTIRFRGNLSTDGGLFTPPTPGSNRITVDIHSDLIQNADAERILAHEFFHALHWLVRPNEPAWLREGLAQVFETRVYTQGKFNVNNLAAGFAELRTSLQGEMHVDAISAAQYGHVLLYFWYLYERCGGEDLFWSIVDSSAESFGDGTIAAALRKKPMNKAGCRSFTDSFIEFELARAINTRAFEGEDPGRWLLVSSTLAKPRPEQTMPNAARWARTKPWSPIFALANKDRIDPKGFPDLRAFWIQPGRAPQVVESYSRPSPKHTQVLFLRVPKAKRN